MPWESIDVLVLIDRQQVLEVIRREIPLINPNFKKSVLVEDYVSLRFIP